MSVAEELQVSVSAVVEAEEVDDPLVPVGEDELENLEPENEGVVFVITTGQSRRQSRKSNKTNQSESRSGASQHCNGVKTCLRKWAADFEGQQP